MVEEIFHFADDTDIVARWHSELKFLMRMLKCSKILIAKNVGLTMNESKIKYLLGTWFWPSEKSTQIIL